VKTIVNMGFNRDQAVNALLQYDNDLLRAIDSLTR
jgi:NACalpha-BTF3-like transcription factor